VECWSYNGSKTDCDCAFSCLTTGWDKQSNGHYIRDRGCIGYMNEYMLLEKGFGIYDIVKDKYI
jgi:hypothetical protein